MSDLVKEQLSACLDGELGDAELRLLLKRTARDAGVARPLGRYALISQALRDTPAPASTDFAARVMAAVAQEPPARITPMQRISPLLRYLRPAAGMAVAASVATVAVLALQQPAGQVPAMIAAQDTPAAEITADTLAPSYVVPSISGAASRNTQVVVPSARLTNYVVAHSEYSSLLGRRSVLTGVLVGDDEDADELQVVITDDSVKPESDSAPQRGEPDTAPVER